MTATAAVPAAPQAPAALPLCLEAATPSGTRVLARIGPASPAEAAVALEAASSPDQLEAFTRAYLAGDLEDGVPLEYAHAGPSGPVPVAVEAPTVLSAVAALRVLGSPAVLADVLAHGAAGGR